MNKKNIEKILKLIVLFIFLIFLIYLIFGRSNILSSAERTLIYEKRYIIFLNGLYQTLIISFSSIAIGSILGIFICYLRMNKNKYIYLFGKIIILLLQGLPITVLLLIFYYCIFGKVNIEPTLVAIISFSIYFSAYTAEIYRGALESINKTQIDSAYSLGFTKIQTLKYVIIPQMLSYIIPVFKNEGVSIIKLTSIVGFISICDLTRASEIVRNRTYEAFFPLLLTAFIYYLLCYLFSKLLDLIYKKINPRKACRVYGEYNRG